MTNIVTHRPSFQGDLMIRRIDKLPKNVPLAKPDGNVWIVAHSETGHHHVIDRPKAEVYQPADDAFIAYVRALSDVEVEHRREFDTHAPLKLEAGGVYEIRRQREYVPQGFRRAAD